MVSYSRKNYCKPLMDYLKDKISWDNFYYQNRLLQIIIIIRITNIKILLISNHESLVF